MAVFSLENYRNLLTAFQEKGYHFRLFSDGYDTKNIVYLRHDIDFWLPYALPIAQMEAELGILSSFFFLIDSESYNPFDSGSISVLKQIAAQGHYVGLHVDENNVQTTEDLLNRIALLRKMIPVSDYCIVSRHRPSLALQNCWITEEFTDTYENRFFKDIEYASDSRGEWRYGYPTERQAFHDGTSFQLLTHPIWWVNSGSNPDKIKKMLEDRDRYAAQSIHYLNFMK